MAPFLSFRLKQERARSNVVSTHKHRGKPAFLAGSRSYGTSLPATEVATYPPMLIPRTHLVAHTSYTSTACQVHTSYTAQIVSVENRRSLPHRCPYYSVLSSSYSVVRMTQNLTSAHLGGHNGYPQGFALPYFPPLLHKNTVLRTRTLFPLLFILCFFFLAAGADALLRGREGRSPVCPSLRLLPVTPWQSPSHDSSLFSFLTLAITDH